MRKRTFTAELLAGHKEDALQLPFDPVEVWQIPPAALWRGRRGHVVVATVNGVTFESCVVPRQKKFFLLVDRDTKRIARLVTGDKVSATVKPSISRKGLQ
jgi:hypothetical protein